MDCTAEPANDIFRISAGAAVKMKKQPGVKSGRAACKATDLPALNAKSFQILMIAKCLTMPSRNYLPSYSDQTEQPAYIKLRISEFRVMRTR